MVGIRRVAPKGASGFEDFVASLKRCPDTKQRIANDQRPTTNDQRPTTNLWQPPASYDRGAVPPNSTPSPASSVRFAPLIPPPDANISATFARLTAPTRRFSPPAMSATKSPTLESFWSVTTTPCPTRSEEHTSELQ